MQNTALVLTLTLSLLTLACNKDNKRGTPDHASSENPASSDLNHTPPAATSSPISTAKASPEQLTSTDIEKRKKMHQIAMMNAALDSVNKGPEEDDDEEEAVNKAVQEWINDPVLYGERRYASADQIKDTQISYHLPQKATEIQLLKEAAGHYALYKISEQDFIAHMVMVWERYREEYVQKGGKRWIKHSDKDVESSLMGRKIGSLHYITYGQKEDKEPANKNAKITSVRVSQAIIDSGWKPLENAMQYQGPIRTNGGISTYYYDRDTGYAFHDVGYW
ncbi:MAG: hypothetical protein ACPIA7_05645 [Akkermansiaceae bacterium]